MSNRPFVIALAAPSLSGSAKLPKKKKAKAKANGKKVEEHWNTLIIHQGQDIGEEILTYFQNRAKRFENSNGDTWKGWIMSAYGRVLHPILENSSATAGSCVIHHLKGEFIICEDGQVQQSGPLTLCYFSPSCGISSSRVSGRLVAAEGVQVVVASFSYPTEDE